METKIEKKYPYLGKVTKTEGNLVNSFDTASAWKDANTAFNWLNFEYPLYHSHVDWEILIVLNDCIEQTINGVTSTLSVGAACLIGPKDRHSLNYPNGKKNAFQGVSLLVRDEYLKQFFALYSPTLYDRLLSTPQAIVFSLPISFLEVLTDRLLSIQNIYGSEKEFAKEQCNLIFQSVLLQCLMQHKPMDTIPDELAMLIRSLNNPNLSPSEVKGLIAQMPYSYVHLTRLFKKYTNCTITQYVNNVKLEHAKDLLSTTKMTTLQIAQEIHFESLSYFIHLFKKHFGTTPSQYRHKQ